MNTSLSAQFNYSTVFWAPFICHVGISSFETSLLSPSIPKCFRGESSSFFPNRNPNNDTDTTEHLRCTNHAFPRTLSLVLRQSGRSDSSRRSRDVIFKLRSAVQIHRARHQTGFRQPAVILPHLNAVNAIYRCTL